jgi:hypothetical protein
VDQVRVIDPAPAVARQTQRVETAGLLSQAGNDLSVNFFTSGPETQFSFILKGLIGETGVVKRVDWKGNFLA